MNENRIFEHMKQAIEVEWANPHLLPAREAYYPISDEQIFDASARLNRFSSFFMSAFPETIPTKGIIESPLTAIPNMKEYIEQSYQLHLPGTLYLKRDDSLAIAGSVKARGGIYEVVKHAEDILIRSKLLNPQNDYACINSDEIRKHLGKYTIEVGSTGNLGLSIGIISAALGFEVIVHMSADAKEWKKTLLRSKGVNVKEYAGDYSMAVDAGCKSCENSSHRYFVDDEHSVNLFLGYAVAAERLQKQLENQQITVDCSHPLFVYIPCGVGGAPGGIMYALRKIFKDNVHIFFIEPTQAPCMLLGLVSGKFEKICVQDIGLHGLTEADGLAVSRCSSLVSKIADTHLAGEFTVEDSMLYKYLGFLWKSEKIFIEPSSCAAFAGPARFNDSTEIQDYITRRNLADKLENSCHICWATGGNLVPADIREGYLNKADI